MGESSMAIQPKDGRRIKRSRRPEDRTSEASLIEKTATKSSKNRTSWRTFFGLFTRSSDDRFASKKSNLSRKESEDIYLNEINDELALAIYLPEDVRGKDVKVSIELEAIKREIDTPQGVGLKITKESPSKATFSGIIKVPSNVTIKEISQMPLYFANATGLLRSNGQYSHKIETVIKPLEDNLPSTIDKDMVVADVKLLVNLQNVKKVKRFEKRQKTLNHAFIRNVKPKMTKSSLHTIKTEEIIDEIAESKKCYDEDSKNIVKGILSHVVQKVQVHDTSTQYSQLINTVSKEIDVQKSLLLKSEGKDSSSKALTKISEKNSLDSLYPNSSSSNSCPSPSDLSETDNSLLYLKVPTNTPNLKQPRYVIKYDSRLSIPERRLRRRDDISLRVLHPYYEDVRNVSVNIDPFSGFGKSEKQAKMKDTVKADIDKTLELLETAKHKLISYLDTSLDTDDTSKLRSKARKVRDFLPTESSGTSFERYASPQYQSKQQQFFLGPKNEEAPDLITFSKEDLTPQLNTIQNIYSSNGDGSELQRTKAEEEETLKRRYSGDYHEKNKLAYEVVENDISLMIKELLQESNAIKELAIKEMGDNGKTEDVKIIIESLLDGITGLVYEEPVVCFGFCLFRDLQIRAPIISVKMEKSKSLRREDFNKDTLIDKLEKGGKFLSEIYNEMCSDLMKPTEVLVYENHSNLRKVCQGKPEGLNEDVNKDATSSVDVNELKNHSSIVLPCFKEEYISQQELNNSEELDYIEENVKLNVDAHQTVSNRALPRSESVTPSTLASHSGSSIEINTNESLIKQ